jgi:hypothetical protein
MCNTAENYQGHAMAVLKRCVIYNIYGAFPLGA